MKQVSTGDFSRASMWRHFFQDVPPGETVAARIIWIPKEGIETSLVDIFTKSFGFTRGISIAENPI